LEPRSRKLKLDRAPIEGSAKQETITLTAAVMSGARRVEPARSRARNPRHVKDFGQGRLCADPGCRTVLSRYNESAFCWVHNDLGRRELAPYVTLKQAAQ